MRLGILDRGHTLGTKALFALIRLFTREPVLDVIKLVRYRPDFYAAHAVTEEAMRGPSAWSVGDRELMAAIVAQGHGCEWCTRAHSAVARAAYGDAAKVSAALEDSANTGVTGVDEPLQTTLGMLRKLTREHTIDAADMRAVLAAGASREQISDALAVCFAFSITARLADAFGFSLASDRAFAAGAKYLLQRGYR